MRKLILTLVLALAVAAQAQSPPTFPLKLTVVSGLHDQFRQTSACSPTTTLKVEVWANYFGSTATLAASGGVAPYAWKFPDGTSQTGAQVTWKLKKTGCLGVRDSSNLFKSIYVQGIPPGPPTTVPVSK